MKITKAASAVFLTTLISLAGLSELKAQVPGQQQQQEVPDYTEEQLESFVDVTEDIMEVQQTYQQKMVSAIQEEGLTPQEFQSMSQTQGEEQPEISEEKQQSYANAMNQVMSIQQEMNAEMQSTVEEHEMNVQEYQKMAMNIQRSPELSKKVDAMMKDEMD